jgi:hypothetical protein
VSIIIKVAWNIRNYRYVWDVSIGDEKYPLADDFETLSIRTFLVVVGTLD